jgi:dihydrofolate reductase
MILAARGGHRTMSHVTCQISVSLDGFVAGPNQSLENPLGEGGDRLHEWAFATASWREQHGKGGGEHTADADVADAMMRGVGAFVMGRKMFGGGDGPWDEDWRGWWGEDPPFHAPVLVLTHHPREPLEMQGGTTFTFVTRCSRPAPPPATRTSRSPAARAPCSSTSPRASSTSCTCTSSPPSSGPASGCSTASAIPRCSPSRWSPRRRSRTSGTASRGSGCHRERRYR